MRSVIATAAIVMAATFVQIDGISILPLAAQDRVAARAGRGEEGAWRRRQGGRR